MAIISVCGFLLPSRSHRFGSGMNKIQVCWSLYNSVFLDHIFLPFSISSLCYLNTRSSHCKGGCYLNWRFFLDWFAASSGFERCNFKNFICSFGGYPHQFCSMCVSYSTIWSCLPLCWLVFTVWKRVNTNTAIANDCAMESERKHSQQCKWRDETATLLFGILVVASQKWACKKPYCCKWVWNSADKADCNSRLFPHTALLFI